MSMTRHDFTIIAETIAELPADVDHEYIAIAFSNKLSMAYPLFRVSTFREAVRALVQQRHNRPQA